MPIAPHKWAQRQQERAKEQRADAARAALLLARAPRVPDRSRSDVSPGHAAWGSAYDYATELLDGLQGQLAAITARVLDQQYIYQPLSMTFQTGASTLATSDLTNAAWATWNSGTASVTNYYTIRADEAWGQWTQPTEEERREAVRLYEEQRRVEQERLDEMRRVAALAHGRALATFLSVLTPLQRREFDEFRYISVTGSSGRHYRIDCTGGQAGNVYWLDGDRDRPSSLCCHPRERVPHPDAWLTQKLWLETDEEAFIALANYSEPRPNPITAQPAQALAA